MRQLGTDSFARVSAAFSIKRNLQKLLVPPRTNCGPADGLRALSILSVIACHTVLLLGLLLPLHQFESLVNEARVRVFVAGELGVDAFFVISGFLITGILIAEYDRCGRIDLRRFYLRRALRLLPAYYTVLAFLYLRGVPNRVMVWTYVAYVNNFVPFESQFMGWAWSLAIEEQFYIAYPLMFLVVHRLRWTPMWVLCGLMGLAFAVRLIVAVAYELHLPVPLSPYLHGASFLTYFEVDYIKPHTRFGAILLGVIAAYCRSRTTVGQQLDRHVGFAAAGLFVAVVAIAFVALVTYRVPAPAWPAAASLGYVVSFRYIFAGAIAYLLLLSLGSSPVARLLSAILGARIWYPVAQLSYSAYLLHPLLAGSVHRLMFSGGPITFSYLVVSFVVTAAVSLLAAATFYLTIERPFMNLRPMTPA